MEKNLTLNKKAAILDELIKNLFLKIKKTNSLMNFEALKSIEINSNQNEFQEKLKIVCCNFLAKNNSYQNSQVIQILELLDLLAQKDDLEYTKNLTKEDLKMMGERMGKKFMASENFN